MAIADEPARELSLPPRKPPLGLRGGSEPSCRWPARGARSTPRLLLPLGSKNSSPPNRSPGPAVHLRPVAKQKPSVAWTTGKKRVLFIRVDFSDREGNPLNDESTNFSMKRTNEFLGDNSYGKLTIDTTLVPGVLRMPKPASLVPGRAGEPR